MAESSRIRITINKRNLILILRYRYCAAKAFDSCPAIISRRPESQNTSKEPQLNTEEVSREPRKRRPKHARIAPPCRLNWPCVSDLQSIYKAESWQRAVTLDDSTPQCRLCENRCGVSTSLLRSRHHRQVKHAVKT